MFEKAAIKETHKPHIERLPVIKFQDYEITDSEIAVSIALFHSDIDSATMSPSTSDRLKNIHAKGAIWAAMSIIRNTDLAAKGVGIYFHIEESIFDTVSKVFERFEVPEKFIRRLDIKFPPPTIDQPRYGKKFICVEDTIPINKWLVVDSDAFFCTTRDPILLYDKLKVFQNPSAIKSEIANYSGDNFSIWVHGLCAASGIPFFPNEDLFGQELRCFYSLEHWTETKRPDHPTINGNRPVINSQLFLLPVKHPLTEHIKKFYKTCYQDEFLIALWNSVYNQVSDLKQKIGGLTVYNFESQYLNRNKELDKKGYLAHIVPDKHGPEQKDVDLYYGDFYAGLTHLDVPNTLNSKPTILSKLIETRSDKQHPKGHQYGKFYDMLFESMSYRKKRPLRILEIGVSLFGEGSISAFQESDMVEHVVGLDILTYTGNLNDKATFHKMDAYQLSTINFLMDKYPNGFDIIIDDGTHKSTDQLFFFNNYDHLLCEDGKLVCEDVIDRDFFQEMCVHGDCYGIDGWANINTPLDQPHFERILVKDKPEILHPMLNTSVSDVNNYTPPVRKTFHVLEIPYSNGKEDFACAFIQRIFKWCRAMRHLGHKIIYYGHAKSEVDCDELVAVYDDQILERCYGHANYYTVPINHDMDDDVFKNYAIAAEPEIRKRVQADEFVLAFYGYGHFELCKKLMDLPIHIVEPSIGYPDAFSENRAYQSVGKMHFDRGRADLNTYLRENFPELEYNQWPLSKYNSILHTMPERNHVVIPNFFDFDHFEYKEEKEDYMCFVGRINICKGLADVFKLAEYTNTRLVAAGVGQLEKSGLDIPRQLEFVGVADIQLRSDIYANAIAHVCPSIYLEPFLGAGVESLYGGTPHITSNWGAPMDWVIDGKTGWRCQNFDHMVWALENIDQISPKDCKHQALQYSKERVSLMYHEYFNIILQNRIGGRWSINPKRKRLDWLYKDMSEEEIQNGIKEIQQSIKKEQ